MEPVLAEINLRSQFLEQGAQAISDVLAPQFAPASLFIQEWKEYWLNLPGAEKLRVGSIELHPQHASWFRLCFENQLGLAHIQPIYRYRVAGSALTVEVLSPKFATHTGHLNFFKALLDDLHQRTVRLPFTFQASTRRSVQEALQPPTPLYTLHFLCQHFVELSDAISIILAMPHRKLIDERVLVNLGAANSVDSEVVLSIFQDSARWVRTGGHPLSEKLGGYVPTHIWQKVPEESFDTPENRFVLHFLFTLLNAIDHLVFQSWWGKVSQTHRNRLQELRSLLNQSIVHPVFEGVGEQSMIPFTSQVLLRRDGYRQLLALWQQFHQASQPFFQPLQKAIDLRNVAELYEYWVFFALAEEIGEALEVPPRFELRSSDEFGLDWSSEAVFDGKGRLVFNRKFSPDWSRFEFVFHHHAPGFRLGGGQPLQAGVRCQV